MPSGKIMSIISQHLYRRILPILVFGIAMGFMEAVIVVYLRELYFPNGFDFPLTLPDDPLILFAELVREITTVIMLLALAWVAARTYLARFAWFLFTFAVWDIFYYVGLKVFLGWPDSLLTWDILYLIPVTWIGPVLAPVISSVFMVILAYAFLLADQRGLKIRPLDWLFIWLGAFLIFITFIWDFSAMIFNNGLAGDFIKLADNEKYLELVSAYVPEYYNWPLFVTGIFLISMAIIRILRVRPAKH